MKKTAAHERTYTVMPSNGRMDSALKKVSRSAGDLARLAGQWTHAAGTSVWWDDYYQIFAAEDYRRTYPALFGSSRAARAVLAERSLNEVRRMWSSNRWHGPMDLVLQLPSDAVLIPAGSSKKGVVVLSGRERRALKLNYELGEVESEVRNWGTIQAAGITNHVPELLDHGRIIDSLE